ncbi:protein of unknown function [Xenorhabdus nematophila AN6/1]|nr:protein of unknown function [Xenorhabdus nematophila AN6/1]
MPKPLKYTDCNPFLKTMMGATYRTNISGIKVIPFTGIST